MLSWHDFLTKKESLTESLIPDNHAKDSNFMNLTNSLRELIAKLFGKKNVKEEIPRQFIFKMGTRWGRLNLSRGQRNITLPAKPSISIEFSWDHRKSGEIPGSLEARTVQPGSMKFAHALKTIAHWAIQNNVAINYTAEPDRLNYYGKVLDKIGFVKKELPHDKYSGYQHGAYYPPQFTSEVE